jgi:peptidase M50B-like protein
MAADLGMAWTTGVVAFVAAVPLWRFTKHTITVAHEGGHAMFGVLLGQKVQGVRLTADGGGVTRLPSKMPWLADLIITLAGYLGPSALGLGGVFLLLRGQPDVVLWGGIVLLALILVKLRNPLGFVAVIGTGVVLYWVARHWTDPAQLAFGYFWVWFLLIGGVRTITSLFWATYAQDGSSDAAVLERLTLLPDVLWLAVFWFGTMAALVYGGAILLRHPV